jgi:hypothetical protein
VIDAKTSQRRARRRIIVDDSFEQPASTDPFRT